MEIVVKCVKNHVNILILSGHFYLRLTQIPHHTKKESNSRYSPFQTSILNLIQSLDERHLRYVLHNHDIIRLLVLLP